MEVTRRNFKESLPLIRDSIDRADFLVIDTEFTGLSNGRDVSMFDSPAEYYSTVLNGSSEFMLIQFGLCAFYWDAATQNYKNEAYNFYLFPRGRPGPEKLFLCQSSSLDFLASQGFDFNKLIRDGISFMTEPAETKLRDIIIEKHKAAAYEQDSITIPDEHKKYIDQVCDKVRNFLDEKKTNEFEVDRCNAFVRRLLYQELKVRFKDEVYIETVVLENKDRILKVSRLTDDVTEKCKDQLKKKKEWEEFEEAVGFSKVARMISQSEKLVIGHNMLLDVLHTLNHFFQPLKNLDYSAFKEFTHCMFPKLLDTKYMSSLPPFKDKVYSSVLRHLYSTLSEDPFSIPKVDSESGRGYVNADDKQHEAGYDAYVTGLCFLGMHAHLRRGERARVRPADAALQPFLNKLFLARTAHADSPYINLAGADPTPCRDHVFHLTFPKEWKRNSISDLFRPFGPITVQFLDDTSAIVLLAHKEKARYVLQAFDDSNRFKVIPYAKYKRLTSTPPYQQQLDKLRQELDRSKAITTVEAQATLISTSKGREDAVSTSNSSPEKSVRERSNSTSSVASNNDTSSPVSRKRTSSGVFQIDEVEPPVKRDKETLKPKKSVIKIHLGKQDSSLDKIIIKDKRKEKELTNFESSKAKCVAAFKESDSWD